MGAVELSGRMRASDLGGPVVTQQPVTYAAFFEEIARRASAREAYATVVAGLTMLRVLEAWTDAESLTVWGIDRIEKHAACLAEEEPTRAPMMEVLRALRRIRTQNYKRVAPAVYEYARALEFDAEWRLAVDVYESLVRWLADRPLRFVVQCHIRLGACYRHLNCASLSAISLERARTLATVRGDRRGELRARIGQARLAILRGDLPGAESMLVDVLRRARGRVMAGVRSRALHDLADLALRRNQPGVGARLAFAALELCEEESERYRILSDIGVALGYLHLYDSARDAYWLVADRATERAIRWAAYINLMYIESLVRDRDLFDKYARIVAQARLTPELSVHYQLIMGEGLLRFGEAGMARDHLRRALAMAAEYGLNEQILESERLLAGIVKTPEVRAQSSASAGLSEIATALRQLRLC